MIKVAICCSGIQIRKKIAQLCEKIMVEFRTEFQVEHFSSGEELLVGDYPQVLILGVQLKRISGISVKEILEKVGANTKIIFVAENRNFMSEAFGKNVYGFFTIPLKEEMFCEILRKIIQDVIHQSYYVFCMRDSEIHKVYLKDIVYMEVCGRKTKIYVREDKGKLTEYVSEKSLRQLEEELDSKQVIRANRYQIVNAKYIVDINRQMELENQITISIGKAYKDKIKEKMYEYRFARERIHRNAATAVAKNGRPCARGSSCKT